VLVIAFGNPLREDDGAAWAVAEALEGRHGLDVMRVHQLTPELAEVVSTASRVVFVDAARGEAAGEVRRQQVTAADEAWTGTHTLDPARLLALCRALYGRAPRASVVSIAGARFGFGSELSPAVRRAVRAAARRVLGRSWRARERRA
jgi:hydrogenase maturation protease